MDFRWDIIQTYAPLLLKGTLYTIGLSFAGILIGSVLGLLIGLGRMVKKKWVSIPLNCYIAFFRGTPIFVQLLIVHFGVAPELTGQTNAILATIIALSLNSAAYIAEIFRGGIQSIDPGQLEGARSPGMSHWQAMRYVILPQAFKRTIPPLGNEFIVLIKESSIAAIIATPELTFWGRQMAAEYFRVWEPYLAAAVIYLILTLSMSMLLNRLERRLETR